MSISRAFLIAALVAAAATSVQAVTVSGFLDDPANPALVWSDLGSPLFGDDFEIANNVALHTFSVIDPSFFGFVSQGFALGGVDPYFTLFSGTGGTATFLGSNFTEAFSTGGDFDLSFFLGAGDYTLAIGAFANMSFAENFGSGTLADGFTQLGGPFFLGNSYYQLEFTPIPEPSYLIASALGVLVALLRKRIS